MRAFDLALHWLMRAQALLRRPAVISSGISIVLRGLTLFSKLLLSLLLARMLPAAEVGIYGLITAVLAFGLLAVGLEFYSYSMREFVTATPSQCVNILANQSILYFGTFGVVTLFALIFGSFAPLPPRYVVLTILLLVVEQLSLDAMKLLVFAGRQIAAYIVLFLRGGLWVYIVSVILFAIPHARQLENVLIAWLAGAGLAVVFAAFCLRDMPWRELRTFRIDKQWILVGLSTIQPFLITALAVMALTYTDRFIIDAFLGRDALGIYTFYSTIAIGILSFGTSISHHFLPRIIAGHGGDAMLYRKTLQTFLGALSAASVLIICAAAVIILPVLNLLRLDVYADHIDVFYVMLAGCCLRVISDVPSYALYAARADRALLGCNLAAVLMSLVLNGALVPRFGLIGAAIAMASSSFLLLAALAATAARHGYLGRSHGPSRQC